MDQNMFKTFCVWFFSTPANKFIESSRENSWVKVDEKTETIWKSLENSREDIYYNIEDCIDNSLDLEEGGGSSPTQQMPLVQRKNKLSIVNYCYNLIIETTIDRDVFFNHEYFCMSYCLNQYNVYNRAALWILFKNIHHKNAVKMKKTMELQIIETVKIPTAEGFLMHYAIVKTMWISLIQRHWKKLCAERKRILAIRASPYQQKLREIQGKYGDECLTYPSARGILSCYSVR